jgi:UDPglucose 6-dehydrogenase
MNISVVGTGYVGLVTGTCFAETGVTVTCVDIDEQKIKGLNQGKIPIYEPGLEAILTRNKEKERLFFTTSIKDSIKEAEVVFIAVGTPPDEDGSADLKHVLGVAREIGKYMQHYLLVVTKSTVPVGTAEKVKKAVQEELDKRNADIEFDVASNPEFLKEGDAIKDFLHPDRIVVGVESGKAEKVMRRLYKPFVLNNHPILFMDIRSSEMTKYVANAMLATKISFMNDVANLCERVGANVNLVRNGIGSDTRIGNKFIYPGAGYGGSCFPKDVKALIKTARDHDYHLQVLEAVEAVNGRQKIILFDKVMKHYNGQLKGKRIGIWGLSFKPKTDDMREAPSLEVIDRLLAEGAEVLAYDPVAMEETRHRLGDKIQYGKDQYDVLVDADGLVMVTEWSEFRLPNFQVIKKLMREPVVFDGRNIYEPQELMELGFKYYGIGV